MFIPRGTPNLMSRTNQPRPWSPDQPGVKRPTYMPGNGNGFNYGTNWSGGFNDKGIVEKDDIHSRKAYYWQPPDPDSYRYSGGGVTEGERADWLKRQGYDINARPWEYNDSSFKNPYMNKQMGTVGNRIEEIAGRRSNVSMAGKNWGADQRQFGNILEQRAMGQGPSVAQDQLQAGTDRNIAQAFAMGQSGGGPASMRTAMYQGGDARQQMANQASQLRSQEMMQAGQQYGDFMQGARAGDIAAQQAYQTGMAGEEAQRDSMIQAYTQMGMSAEQAQWAANMELESKRAEQHKAAQATRAGIAAAGSGPSPWWGLAGAGISAAGAIGAGYVK